MALDAFAFEGGPLLGCAPAGPATAASTPKANTHFNAERTRIVAECLDAHLDRAERIHAQPAQHADRPCPRRRIAGRKRDDFADAGTDVLVAIEAQAETADAAIDDLCARRHDVRARLRENRVAIVARRLLGRPDMKLKALLMEQSFISGIGNIYSDEILWEAGLRGDRTPRSLSNMEIRRLFRSIVEILHEAVKHRGSTLSDQQYVDVLGRAGEYQQFHNVYDRAGKSCNRCRGTITKEKFQGRSTFFCPSCQV